MPPEITIVNMPPVWVQWLGDIGLFLFGLAMVAIAIKVVGVLGQVGETLAEVNKIVEEDVHRDMMPDVKAITRNVKQISDDAASTTHNVTGTVNRVSNVVGSVAGKLESPAIRAVGTITGIMAGMRAISGGKKEEIVIEPKKRGGILGIIKKK
jgi:uncharacterized protein YoxC